MRCSWCNDCVTECMLALRHSVFSQEGCEKKFKQISVQFQTVRKVAATVQRIPEHPSLRLHVCIYFPSELWANWMQTWWPFTPNDLWVCSRKARMFSCKVTVQWSKSWNWHWYNIVRRAVWILSIAHDILYSKRKKNLRSYLAIQLSCLFSLLELETVR